MNGNFLAWQLEPFLAHRVFQLTVSSLGRTVPTYRLQLEKERRSWGLFRTALRADEQPAFDNLFTYARTYADAASAVARPCASEAIFMSMILGLYQEVQRLRLALATVASVNRPITNTNYHRYIRQVQAEL
jgi:hypothetical protein